MSKLAPFLTRAASALRGCAIRASLAAVAGSLLAAFAPAAAAQAPQPPAASVPLNAIRLNGERAQGVTVPEAAGSRLNAAEALTIETWVNVTSWTRRNQSIVTKGDAWGLLRMEETPRLSFRTMADLQTGAHHDLVSTKDMPIGKWTHVAAVFTGTRKQLYIDGELTADAEYTGPLVPSSFPVMFGGNASNADRTFNGTIDSARLWSIARGSAQLVAKHREYLRGSETGLLGDWRFNEASGVAALDSAAGGRHGVLQAGKPPVGTGSLPARVNGLLLDPPANGDLAMYFNNRTGQYPPVVGLTPVTTLQWVELPAPPVPFHFTTGMTAEFWIKPEAIPATGSVSVVSKGAGAWEVRYLETAKVSFVTSGVLATVPGGDLTELISRTRVEPRVWTHVAVVWDPAAKEKRIFINGQLDTTVPADGTLGTNALNVLLGAEPAVAGQANGYYGAIEETRLWRIARAPQEIFDTVQRRLNGTEPGLAGVWSFNVAEGPATPEGSGRALAGVLAPGMSTLNRVDGVAHADPLFESYTISLNGTSQFATVADDPAFAGMTSLTIEAWINPEQAPGLEFMHIVMKGEAGWALSLDNELRLRFKVGPSELTALRSDRAVPLGVWSHVAVVVDGVANKTTFYINGKAAGTVNSAVIAHSPGALAFGRHGGTRLSNFFKGGLDEIRIWTTARTPTEVSLLAFSELTGPTTGLIGHWSFTEGSGNVVADTVAGRNATLSGTNDFSWRSGPVFRQSPGLPSGLNLVQNPKAAGLWIGQVSLRKVNEVQTAINGTSDVLTPTNEAASIRVILHVDGGGQVRLLKDVIVMQTQSTGVPPPPPRTVLVTDPTQIQNYEGVVRRGGKRVGLRYGTAAFDFEGLESGMVGGVGAGVACAGRIDLSKTAPTNPYRHKFHPDHGEGFDIIRVFSIQFDGAPGDPLAAAPGFGVDLITGTYRESIAGLHKITLKTEGTITLNRISTVATLNTP